MKKKFLFSLFFYAWLGITFFAIGADPARNGIQTVKFTTAAPQIDGDSNDSCWSQAAVMSNFRLLGSPEKQPATRQTRARMLHDNNMLYIMIEADEPQGVKLRTQATKLDDKVFFDDCVEVLLSPNPEDECFYQFSINSINVRFDAQYLQHGLVHAPEWDSQQFRSATKHTEKGWQVEMQIPLAELGLEKADGRFHFNIMRNSYSGERREISSFAPAETTFQDPKTFTTAELKDASLNEFLWRLSPPEGLRITQKGGRFELGGQLIVQNRTGKHAFFQISTAIGAMQEKTFKGMCDHEQYHTVRFAIPVDVTAGGRQMLRITLKNSSGRILLVQQFPIAIHHTALKIALTEPAYRNNIYSDMTLTELIGQISSDQEELADSAVQLTLRDSKGQALSRLQLPRPQDFHLPLPPALPTGSYTLETSCGKEKTQLTIRKLPAQKGEIRFDRRGVMFLDGRPTIPVGWFRLTPQDGALDGCNIRVDYNAPWFTDDKVQAILDDGYKSGIKTFIYPFTSGAMFSSSSHVQRPFSEKELAGIRSRIEKFRSHPGLAGWYLADEPEYEPILPERLQQLDRLCRTTDPHHPTLMVNNSVNGILKYAGIGDISMPDCYPGYLQHGKSGMPMSRYYEMMQTSARLPRRAQWATPQGFDWTCYGSDNHRAPDFTELRQMHYLSVLAGMTGFIWYSYELNYAYPAVRIGVRELFKESRLLQDLLLHPETRVMLKTDHPDVVAASYRQLNGRNYLIAVNMADTPSKFTVPYTETKPLFVFGEKAPSHTVAGEHFSDILSPGQARVYVSDPQLAQSHSLAAIPAAIAMEEQKLQRPGNLLYYHTSGVKFSTSPMLDPRYPNHVLADGVRNYVKRHFNRTASPTGWIVMHFPKPLTARTLAVYGDGLHKLTVEAKAQNGQWRKLAEFASPTPRTEVILVWPNQESFQELRLSGVDAAAIGELELYNSALTPTAATAAQPSSRREPGVLAHWGFEQDNVTLLHDDNRNALHLAPRSEGAVPQVSFEPGIHGQAIRIAPENQGQYIQLDRRLLELTPPFTIAAWIKKTQIEPKQSIIVATCSDQATGGFEFAWSWRRLLLRWGCGPNRPKAGLTSPAASLNVNAWHHVAATHDGKRAVLYIDAQPVAEKIFSDGQRMMPAVHGKNNFTLGQYPAAFPAYGHVGLLDEVYILTYAASPEAIRKLSENTIPDIPPAMEHP